MTAIVSLILAFMLTLSGSPVKSFIADHCLENYKDVSEGKEVQDNKPSLRADLIDRRDNFDFKDSADNAVDVLPLLELDNQC